MANPFCSLHLPQLKHLRGRWALRALARNPRHLLPPTNNLIVSLNRIVVPLRRTNSLASVNLKDVECGYSFYKIVGDITFRRHAASTTGIPTLLARQDIALKHILRHMLLEPCVEYHFIILWNGRGWAE